MEDKLNLTDLLTDSNLRYFIERVGDPNITRRVVGELRQRAQELTVLADELSQLAQEQDILVARRIREIRTPDVRKNQPDLLDLFPPDDPRNFLDVGKILRPEGWDQDKTLLGEPSPRGPGKIPREW